MKVFTLISLIALSVSGQAFAGGAMATQLASSASMPLVSSTASARFQASAYSDKIASDKRAEMRAKVNPARAAGPGSLASSGGTCSAIYCSPLLNTVSNGAVVKAPNINVQTVPVVVKPGVINTNPVVNVGAMKSVAAIR